MMELISIIRQMMAENKFSEAQKAAEMHLSMSESSRSELLPIYFELLELQDKRIPDHLLIEAAETSIHVNADLYEQWLGKLSDTNTQKYFKSIQLLKIKIADQKGRQSELYSLICDLKLFFFREKVPAQLEVVDQMVAKYFKNDFHLKLQDLALTLMLNNLEKAESLVADLICSCVERASPKGTKEKLLAVSEILALAKEKKQLEIYQNFCRFGADGIKEKKDYKKIAEMIIYFEDFKFQILVLDLLNKTGLDEAASDYAQDIRCNKKYDFVYIQKYFGHLKKYFVKNVRADNTEVISPQEEMSLKLEKPIKPLSSLSSIIEPLEENEILIKSSLKFQSYTSKELIELAISFIQSSFIRAALEATDLAMKGSENNQEFLKACYLKLTCLYGLGDYRAVLDLSMQGLDRSENQDDILSFLYLQAEAFIKLSQKHEAKAILKKIISIDSDYRLTRQRLERLDEI